MSSTVVKALVGLSKVMGAPPLSDTKWVPSALTLTIASDGVERVIGPVLGACGWPPGVPLAFIKPTEE